MGNSDNTQKQSKKSTGKFGESVVCDFLKSKSIEVLERNYSGRGGEIDIVATDGKYLIVCEVKTVGEESNREELNYIDRKQWERIRTLAELYMAEKIGKEIPIRYDLAIVKLAEERIPEIDYIESFYTTND